MRSKRTLLGARRLAILGAGLAVLAAGLPTFGDAGSAMAIVGYQVNGSVVEVTVHNLDHAARTATVFVDALVAGEPVRGSASVTVLGHGRAHAHIGFVSPVEHPLDVGIITDDGAPF